MLGLRNDWLAWQFDRAVFSWGNHVEIGLSARDEKGRPVNKIEDLLGLSLRQKKQAMPTYKLSSGDLEQRARTGNVTYIPAGGSAKKQQ